MSPDHSESTEALENVTHISEGKYQSMLNAAAPVTESVLGDILDIDVQHHWAQDALCAQTDPELFFPEKGGAIRNAVAICAQCPVREECLDAAMEEEADGSGYGRFGIRGGLTARERARIANGSQVLPRQRDFPGHSRPFAA